MVSPEENTKGPFESPFTRYKLINKEATSANAKIALKGKRLLITL